MTAADPGALARLHADSFVTPRPWSAAEIAEVLAGPGSFLHQSAHGFVIGRVIADEAELLTIAVAPAARRRGEGRALVAAFLAEAAKRGAAHAFLEVAADNAAARALYLAAGFAESGRRKAYYHPPAGPAVDALVMTCPLGAGH
ncbi:MAG: ribosomal-protein-alanine N-acetyltransferase [Limimaricola sp.]|uniref:ribosomal protein S18-alanine N-acetyltransferase n=1 Tax=Limimaricola sp. TaxID=2211665 RepID=UPI001DA7F0F7|nr:ribosomal protein S18-alanine N-acetyltransferase [Limimaricola sp.]MBI1417714.1 ribosomal-protein-alanine N-acetyltransferase [Limimaricola sp.]